MENLHHSVQLLLILDSFTKYEQSEVFKMVSKGKEMYDAIQIVIYKRKREEPSNAA